MQLRLSAQHIGFSDSLVKCCALEIIHQSRMSQDMEGALTLIFAKGAFTIYVYNARWVGGQKSGKFVNVYSIKIVNEGRWVVKNV